MREIKFRAWDGEKMTTDFAVLSQGSVIREENPIKPIDCVSINSKEYYHNWAMYKTKKNWVVMQYTGLKDKNGKEIYEGDILKINGGAKDFMVTVTFEYGCFGIRGKVFQDNHNELKYYTDLDFCSVELAGNIHENPTIINK